MMFQKRCLLEVAAAVVADWSYWPDIFNYRG